MQEDWREDILDERNLLQIFRKTPGIGRSTFNLAVATVVAILLLLSIALLRAYGDPRGLQAGVLFSIVREWVDVGFVFSASVLGFFIAGFAIFATVTRPKLFVEMAQVPYPGDGQLSQLKFCFFNFINVFVHYISFLSFCIFVRMAFAITRPFSSDVVEAFDLTESALKDLASVVLLASGLWFTLLVLKLKSFIWNIYQTVMLSIACSEQENDEDGA